MTTSFRRWSRTTAGLGRSATRLVVLLGAGDALAAALQAVLAGRLLGSALAGDAPSIGWLLGFAALALARAGALLASEAAAVRAGAAARTELRRSVLARLLAAGPALLRGRHSGELAATATDRIDALDGYFGRWRPASMLAVLGPAIVLLVALLHEPVVALILALAGLVVPLALALAGIGAAAASRRQFLALERLQVRFLDRVRGIATIVALGRGEAEAAALGRSADELRVRTMRVLRVAFLASVAMDLAAAAALIAVALHAGMAAGTHATGERLGSLLLVPAFFAPLRAFSAAYQDRSHAAGAADALEAVPEPPAPATPARIRTIEARGVAVAFENVVLRWDPSRPPALDGVSFQVAAGDTLVLAGPSGAGKSSVLELLLGFVRPDSGRVRLNGIDIQDLVPEALCRLVGWIGQRPTLFAASIEENIRFARPDASPAEVAEAVRAARLDSVTDALPQGLATRVGADGYGLSGGQAQRVAIARAFLRNAPLLLLDEPTGHLDPATEAEVFERLRRLAIGRTVILATHSAAARAFPGRRIDLRDGRVVDDRARGAA